MAREYLEYVGALAALEPKWQDCPFECHFHKPRFDPGRSEKCGDCLKTKAWNAYRRAAERVLLKKMGEEIADRLTFERLHQAVQIASGCEDTPHERLSCKVGALLACYLSERARRTSATMSG